MKTIQLTLFFLVFALSSFGRSTDSLIYKLGENEVLFNKESKTYRIQSKKGKVLYKKLNFARSIGRHLQVLNEDNELIYFNDELKKLDKVPYPYGLCGTVPHYTMNVLSNKDWFYIESDETFYDYGNEIPAEIIDSVSTSEADSVFFINGRTDFMYTSNFGYFRPSPKPTDLILQKGNQYAMQNAEKIIWYDKIELIHNVLIGTKDNLKAFITLNPTPTYSSLEPFENYLARFELPNGKGGYIDQQGNEYLD